MEVEQATRIAAAVYAMRSAAADLAHPEAAQHLAAAQIPVFPCALDGKAPLTRHGFHDATTDVDMVGHWWRKYPDANIGVPTGAASGLDVVDVDVHGAESGIAAIRVAHEEHLVDGCAWTVRTPSGGLHAYFPHPANTEQRCWTSPSTHVDFRGDGGYVVVPPSRVRRPDGELRAHELSSVPAGEPQPVDAARLRRFLEPPPAHDSANRPARAVAALATMDPFELAEQLAHTPEGGRNVALFNAARRMRDAQFDRASTLGVLGPAAERAGLPRREIESTIRSVYRHSPFAPTQGGGGRRLHPYQAVTL